MSGAAETFDFRGYAIPTHLALMTGGGADTFAVISDAHMQCLRRDARIRPDQAILEVGCGIGRDAIPLSKFLSREGSYVGVDIVRPSIEWCLANISSRHPNFCFVHFDIAEPLHNPDGTMTSRDVQFPIRSASIDRIVLWSVFTHMLPEDAVHYMREFRRMLRPGGRVYASCFLLDEQTLRVARRDAPTAWSLTFQHEHSPGCYLQDRAIPNFAVGYSPPALNEKIALAGLVRERIIRGSWCGIHSGEAGQDVMILRLPRRAQVARTVRSLLGRNR